MKAEDVKATDLKVYFEMDAKTFMAEWKALSTEEKEWFKAEYAKIH